MQDIIQHKDWNGGLLCCAYLGRRQELHILLGTEYRKSSRLDERQRAEATHRRDKQTLQLVVPGGRSQSQDASLIETVIREFWEESARIIDRQALAQCLQHRAESFDFLTSKYRLVVATQCVHETLPQAFAKKVLAKGYPNECLLQLYWLPWRLVRDVGSAKGLLSLHHDTLEPRESRVPLSGFAASLLVRDDRVRRQLDRLAYLDNASGESMPQQVAQESKVTDDRGAWFPLQRWLPWSTTTAIGSSAMLTQQEQSFV